MIALIWSNVSPGSYYYFIHTPIWGTINFHFFVNDIFMVFFFGIAAVEIVNSLSPGGSLHPIKKAVTPLMATFGGIIGPILTFFLLNSFFGEDSFINGWGICTATDIALAWLLAKIIFGSNHPAVSFLLLLAIVDDAIGLVIIAIFYPDPSTPVEPIWLILVILGMLLAKFLNKRGVKSYLPYIFSAGIVTWIGMLNAHLHPALTLVFIIPFLPRQGMVEPFVDAHGISNAPNCSALHHFEKQISPFVDYGLILFGISNAGVAFSQISNLTWIIFGSLLIGKTFGISLFTWIATLMKFELPKGMEGKEVFLAAIIGGLGLTVSIFVAGSAYTDLTIQNAAKMGALFTIFIFVIAILLGKILKIKKMR